MSDTAALVRFAIAVGIALTAISVFKVWRRRAASRSETRELSEAEKVAAVRLRQREQAKKDAENYVPSEEYKIYLQQQKERESGQRPDTCVNRLTHGTILPNRNDDNRPTSYRPNVADRYSHLRRKRGG